MQRPQMEQWCARAGLWLSHFVHVRSQPAGVVGFELFGVAPGFESIARACEASASAASAEKMTACTAPAPRAAAYHPPSVSLSTTDSQ
jgi:hypothetical protein